jgi:cell division protease FtsH
MIDDEVRKLVEKAYDRTKKLLNDKIEAVKSIAEALLKKEVLYKDDLDTMIGRRPFAEPADEAPVFATMSNEEPLT